MKRSTLFVVGDFAAAGPVYANSLSLSMAADRRLKVRWSETVLGAVMPSPCILISASVHDPS